MSSDNPFRIKDKKPSQIETDTIEKIIKKRLNPKPKGKPIKFTWQGFKNMWVGLMGDPLENPFSGEMPAKWKRLQELEDHLMLFFTGFQRFSSDISKANIKNIPKKFVLHSGTKNIETP